MEGNRMKWCLLLKITAAAVLLQGCEADQNERELARLTVGVTSSYLGEAATFTALEKGYFEEHGLDVTL